MASFQEILNRKAVDVEAPKPIPVGSYVGLVNGQGEFAKIGKNNTDCVNFPIKLVQALPDVDQTALQDALRNRNDTYRSLQDVKLNHRLFITEESIHRLTKFLIDDLGLEPEGKSISQLISEAMGKSFVVHLGHRASDNGSTVYLDIKSTASTAKI